MTDLPSTPPDPRLGPRSPQEQAEQFEREARARRPLDPDDERDAEAAGGLLVVGLVAVVAALAVAFAGGAPVAGLYVGLGLFGVLALLVLVHPEYGGTHPDVSRRTVVVLSTMVGTAVVGLLVHLVAGGAWSLPFAVLLGAPAGAAVGWLLGTALLVLVRGLRRLVGR